MYVSSTVLLDTRNRTVTRSSIARRPDRWWLQ